MRGGGGGGGGDFSPQSPPPPGSAPGYIIISKSDPGESGVAGILPMAQIVATKYWVDKPT